MDKRSTGKRWIAVIIAIVLFAISLVSGGLISSVGKDKDNKDMLGEKFKDLSGVNKEVIQGTNPTQKILVVDVDGVITDQSTNSYFKASGFDYDFFMEQLDKAKEDNTIKAVILKVNSPGGGVYASEQMKDKILKLKEETQMPIYTVMGSMAASGGYYISAPTDRIYASNETFTGSIGVIMSSLNLKGLYDKYGIKQENITSGKFKDIGSTGKEMSKEDREILQSLVDNAYERFVKVVADGRSMSESEVKKIADGRIYDGAQAKENGLVDEIGNMDMAVKDLSDELDLKDPTVYRLKKNPYDFSSLFQKATNLLNKDKSDLQILNDMLNKSDRPEPMYLYGE
ncbi:MAG: signal peptide peptidase SppA [Tissierellia bacterium]|nr:signal peptide peptidase SppA [Tissierellia bacterium]